ncbi:hypothetical protein SprV_0200629900 [Sparganum proliferum]
MDEAYHWYLDSLIRRAFNKLKQLAHATAIASTVPDNEKPETPGAKTTLSSKRKASRQLSILTPENLQTCLSRLLQCDAKQASVVELVRCAFTEHRSVPDEEGANESVVVISPDATVSVEGLFAKKPGQPQPDFVNLLVERLEAERKATINHIIMELQRHKRSSADANYVELPELLEALRSVRPEYEKLLAFSSTPHSAAPSRGPPSPGGSVESERPYGEYSCELDETGATMQEQALALAWCKSSQPKNYLMATLKWVLQEQYTHEIEDPPDGTRLSIEVVNRRLVGANIKSRDLLTGIQQPSD